nr:hypothetical protein BaRGS_003645 [Batillaria attramentaria]
MDILTKTLEADRADAEITGYALDTLYHVMSNEPSEEDEMTSQASVDLGEQFTEIFIKNHGNVALLISLLEEYDFHVRWPTVRLLTVLLTNRPKDLQECILVIPMAVSKLMDLLSDSREIIRNDALLLLNQLTKGHANIQKIVAFENAFERILDIIVEEGASDGGIVVEDCLLLLLNLLKNNASNQNFFKEGSYIQRLTQFFDLEEPAASKQTGWSAQKVTNIHLMLQLVRTLVSPSNQNQTVACQKVMNQCGLLKQLCSILMASGVPADVLTETINTVSEVIRGSQPNQEYFASVLAPSNPPRPAIVVLLMSMVNEKQPFVLRCAVLYCFQSFLYKNEVGQSQIIQTLLPTSADANTITAGQLLCGGLFSGDSLSNWFAAVAMLHAVLGNTNQREQLLRVQLATNEVLVAVSGAENLGLKAASRREHESIVENYKELIKEQDQKLNDMSQQVLELQSKNKSATATIEELRGQVQQLKDQNALLKAQKGGQSNNTPQPQSGDNVDALQREIQSLRLQVSEKDGQVERLKTDLTATEARLLSVAQSGGGEDGQQNGPSEAAVLQASVNRLTSDIEELRRSCSQKDSEILSLRSQLDQARAELTQLQQQSNGEQGGGQNDARVAELSEEVRRFTEEKTTLQERLKKSNEENLNLSNKIRVLEEEKEVSESEKGALREELETLKKEQDDLLVLLADQDGRISKFKERLKELGQEVEEDDEDDEDFEDEDDA